MTVVDACAPRARLVAAILPAMFLGLQQAGAGAASPRRGTVFEHLAGTWSGTGLADVSGTASSVRCSVDYSPSGPAQLHLELRCTQGAYLVQVAGDLRRDGDRVAGVLVEQSLGVTGSMAGTVGPDRMRAVVSGMGVSAALSLSMRGDVQAVVLEGLGSLAARAVVTLRRT